MKSIKHVVSVSGGKDSAATLLLALERRARLRGEQIKLRSSRCRVGEDGRGGRQLSFMSDFIELSACSSAYGLCE